MSRTYVDECNLASCPGLDFSDVAVDPFVALDSTFSAIGAAATAESAAAFLRR
jgi:hypothetical protein